MITKTSHKFALRASLVAAALAAALSANAWIVSIAGDTNASGIITTVDYKYSNLAGINTATFSYFVSFNPGTGAAFGNFTDGASVLDVAGVGASNIANNTYSFSGVWTKTALTNLPVASTGTYTALFDLNSDRYNVSFAGAPVPEPAPIAALSVGALALLRRRRRS